MKSKGVFFPLLVGAASAALFGGLTLGLWDDRTMGWFDGNSLHSESDINRAEGPSAVSSILTVDDGDKSDPYGRPGALPAWQPPDPGEGGPGFRLPPPELPADPDRDPFPLGTNLTPVTDWSREWAFVDAFKASRPWISGQGQTWQDGRELELDEKGWVRSLQEKQVARTLMLGGQEGRYPEGEYLVLYEGRGTLVYGFDATRIEASSAPGRDVLKVVPSNDGIYLAITETDPDHVGDYIRDIRVIMPGFEDNYATEIFHPRFLEKIQRYRALRFTHWMETNQSPLTNWSDRPVLDSARYSTEAGVPAEILVELSNRQGIDPWFSMPHRATDEYLGAFARLVRDRLNPDRKVLIEYSNEVWNPAFPQGSWVEQQGKDRWPELEDSDFSKRINWYGLRSAQMCDIWRKSWGESSDRVICVMSSQAANPWTASNALDCPFWEEAPCVAHGIDALGIAPYFGGYLGLPAVEQEVLAWTAEGDGGTSKLFEELTAGGLLSNSPPGGALQEAIRCIESNKVVAMGHGVSLLAYEGGQHLVGTWGVENNEALATLFQNANRDPRMGQIYTTYLGKWAQTGGGLFANFSNVSTYSKWGSWGALEFLDQAHSPKFDALMKSINTR